MTELLPCPFCGAKPYQRIELNPNGAPYPDHHVIWCENLGCTASPETFEVTLEESITAWNTRATPQPLSNPLSPAVPVALPLAVRLRDEAGLPLPQMIAQRRVTLAQERDDISTLLRLANEYEAGTAKAALTGYEEFGPEWQHERALIVAALRQAAASLPAEGEARSKITGIEAAMLVADYIELRVKEMDADDAANIIHILHEGGVAFSRPDRGTP
jgi:hypothetical protein